MNHYKNAVIIVTGGASGIGECLVEQLSALGGNIIVVGRSVQPKNFPHVYFQADMTDEEAVKQFEIAHQLDPNAYMLDEYLAVAKKGNRN